MSIPGFAPRYDEYGGRKGDRTSASFLSRMHEEAYAARSGSVAHPLVQDMGPAGTHISLDRYTLDLLRFRLTEDLPSGGSAEAVPIGYNGTTEQWNQAGDPITVYDSLGLADGSGYLKSGQYGFAKWFGDNGFWEVVQSGGGDGDRGFFPARLTCRTQPSGTLIYSWAELEWTSATAEATIKSGGRTGYTANSATVTVTTTGTASVAEVEQVDFCGPPPTSGTWTLGAATGLAYNISAAALTTALTAAQGTTITATGSMSAGWTLTWATNGVRTTLTVNVSGLLPSGASWPAIEINDNAVDVGTNVWMKRGYRPSTPAVVVLTKTAPGNNAGAPAAFSLYMSGVTGGSFTITWDGTTTPAISYGLTGSSVKAILEAAVTGLTLSAFSGVGTLASPWSFSVTGNTADHTATANGAALKDGSGFRFEMSTGGDGALCGYDLASGFVLGGFNSVRIDDDGCLVAVQPVECASPTVIDGGSP